MRFLTRTKRGWVMIAMCGLLGSSAVAQLQGWPFVEGLERREDVSGDELVGLMWVDSPEIRQEIGHRWFATTNRRDPGPRFSDDQLVALLRNAVELRGGDDPVVEEFVEWLFSAAERWLSNATPYQDDDGFELLERAAAVLTPLVVPVALGPEPETEVGFSRADRWCLTLSAYSDEALYAALVTGFPGFTEAAGRFMGGDGIVPIDLFERRESHRSRVSMRLLTIHWERPPHRLAAESTCARDWLRSQPAEISSVLAFARHHADPAGAPWDAAYFDEMTEAAPRLLAAALMVRLGEDAGEILALIDLPGDRPGIPERGDWRWMTEHEQRTARELRDRLLVDVYDTLGLLALLPWSEKHDAWLRYALVSGDHFARSIAWSVLEMRGGEAESFAGELLGQMRSRPESVEYWQVPIALGIGVERAALEALAVEVVREREAARDALLAADAEERWDGNPYEWIERVVVPGDRAMNRLLRDVVTRADGPDVAGAPAYVATGMAGNEEMVGLLEAVGGLYDRHRRDRVDVAIAAAVGMLMLRPEMPVDGLAGWMARAELDATPRALRVSLLEDALVVLYAERNREPGPLNLAAKELADHPEPAVRRVSEEILPWYERRR